MKFTDLTAHIGKGEFYACYVLTGDDEYLIKKAEDLFVSRIALPDLNLSVFDAAAAEDSLLAAVNTMPFGSCFRLVLGSTKSLVFLDEYLKNPNQSTVIVLRAEKGYKAGKNVQTVDCNRLSIDVLRSSIAAECKKQGCSITSDAGELIAEYTRRYMGRVRGELNKLIDYKNGGTITAEDVALLVKPDAEYRVFELSDAILKGNVKKALNMLDEMLSEGSGASSKVFGLLYSHFRRLMMVSLDANTAASKLELKDYALSVTISQAKNISKLTLKNILDRLHQLDLGLKTGLITDRIGLTTFVVQTAGHR